MSRSTSTLGPHIGQPNLSAIIGGFLNLSVMALYKAIHVVVALYLTGGIVIAYRLAIIITIVIAPPTRFSLSTNDVVTATRRILLILLLIHWT